MSTSQTATFKSRVLNLDVDLYSTKLLWGMIYLSCPLLSEIRFHSLTSITSTFHRNVSNLNAVVSVYDSIINHESHVGNRWPGPKLEQLQRSIWKCACPNVTSLQHLPEMNCTQDFHIEFMTNYTATQHLYSGRIRFESRPGYRLSWQFCGVSISRNSAFKQTSATLAYTLIQLAFMSISWDY